MIRKIITIDESKCIGCRMCADACHEGAIGMVNGKAKLLREDYCDGLGDCLPACPVGAISFEEREAPAYDEKAVKKAKSQKMPCSCTGTMAKSIDHGNKEYNCIETVPSQLSQWPVQIKLVAPNAPYFRNADLLVTADCTAYAYGNFHNDFIKNKVCIIGCPKLDMIDYSEKLTEILRFNEINSITVTRMEVPCCIGIENAVKRAIADNGKKIPLNVVTITTDGKII